MALTHAETEQRQQQRQNRGYQRVQIVERPALFQIVGGLFDEPAGDRVFQQNQNLRQGTAGISLSDMVKKTAGTMLRKMAHTGN